MSSEILHGTIIKIAGPVLDVRFTAGQEPRVHALLTTEDGRCHMEVVSQISAGVRIMRRMSTVLSRRDSVKPSCGPATTDSFTGSAMPRLTKPFRSAIRAPGMVSTISAASPLNTRWSTVES